MYRDNEKKQEANLWIGFIDKNNCYIMQYYNVHKVQPEYNINRSGVSNNYDNLVTINIKSISWARKKDCKKILKPKIITDI